MSLQILHVVEAIIAGTRRNVYALATGLHQRNLSATIACPLRRQDDFGECGFVDDLYAAGVKVLPVPLRRSLHPLWDAAALQALVALLRRGRYDLVHTHSSKAGFVGRLAARIVGVPAVHSPHGLHFLGQRQPAKQHFYLQLERLAAHWSERIIATSPGEHHALLRWRVAPPERIVQIVNGIALPLLPSAAERAGLRQRFGLPAAAPLIGTLARLTEQKNPALFVRAAALVAAQVPDARFVWIGGGELLAEAQALAASLGIADRLFFLGHLERGDALLPMLNIFWLTSHFEGLPYSLLEALAAALPCVATDVVGNRDLIQPNHSGMLVPDENPQMLAQITLNLLAQPATAAALGRAARVRVISEFSQEHMLRKTIQLYDEITTGNELQQPPHTATLPSPVCAGIEGGAR